MINDGMASAASVPKNISHENQALILQAINGSYENLMRAIHNGVENLAKLITSETHDVESEIALLENQESYYTQQILDEIRRTEFAIDQMRLLSLRNAIEFSTQIREAWPPNIKEFRMHCEQRLEAFKLPKLHDPFSETKTNSYLSKPTWSHPLIALKNKNLNKTVDN